MSKWQVNAVIGDLHTQILSLKFVFMGDSEYTSTRN